MGLSELLVPSAVWRDSILATLPERIPAPTYFLAPRSLIAHLLLHTANSPIIGFKTLGKIVAESP